MPFTRTWMEELVVEWLQLKGFLSETNLPTLAPAQGGRQEADIVGARMRRNRLEIVHVETGALANGMDSVRAVTRKFSQESCAAIVRYFRKRFDLEQGVRVDYRKMYVASFMPNTVREACPDDIEMHMVEDFILHEVLETIGEWKANPPHQPISRGSIIVLPDSLWLLALIDRLGNAGLLNVAS